jgi:hypothetical protein
VDLVDMVGLADSKVIRVAKETVALVAEVVGVVVAELMPSGGGQPHTHKPDLALCM